MMLHPEQIPEVRKSLLEFVQQLLTDDPSIKITEWQSKIDDVFSLCNPTSDKLYEKLYAETRQCLEDLVRKLYTSVSSCGDENLLGMYHQHWLAYNRGSLYLNQLYIHLNIPYVRKHKGKDARGTYGDFTANHIDGQMFYIRELALHIWKRYMIEQLKQSLVKVLLEGIHTDRIGGNVNASIIKLVIHSFVEVERYKHCPMGLYEELIETPFLKETAEHCRSEVPKLMDLNCVQYIRKVVIIVDKEVQCSRKLLHPNSCEKVKSECQLRLMGDRFEFLQNEFKDMVRMERRQELDQMYHLMSPFPDSLKILIAEMELLIKQTGHNAVKDLKDDSTNPAQFVEAVLKVHSKYTDLIKEVFNGDHQFIGALDRALAETVHTNYDNSSVCKAPEWLAKYCDNLLKKNAKIISEIEVNDGMSRCMTVFKYIEDKDIYHRFYTRMLARRLIHGMSRSMGAEEAMISRLKQSCGHSFTDRLQRMYKDISLSSDLNQNFKDYEDNRLQSMFKDMSLSSDLNKKSKDSEEKKGSDLGLHFSIKVLQAGAWPVAQIMPSFAIPQQLEQCISRFETFYGTQHSSRRLTWVHTLCTADVKLLYLKKPYVVSMSTFQMAVLLPYEIQDTLTVKELQATTQLPEKELLKQIQSLVDSKILLADSEDNSNENTSFSLNLDYSNKHTKFRIMAAVQKAETKQEVEKTHKEVDSERMYSLQPTIVRIMKSHKHLTHNMLVQEVFTQSPAGFVPSVVMIKNCIESLIQKEYMERKNPNKDEYSYVA